MGRIDSEDCGFVRDKTDQKGTEGEQAQVWVCAFASVLPDFGRKICWQKHCWQKYLMQKYDGQKYRWRKHGW